MNTCCINVLVFIHTKKGDVNNSTYPCIFIKKLETEFPIIAIYVDDLNLDKYLKKKIEMKNFSKNK